MIASHYLDNIEIFTETRGQVGLIGKFNSVPVVVLSTGIGKTSTAAYLSELCMENNIKRVVYLGDCITQDCNLTIGSIMYISKAYDKDKFYYASENLINHTKSLIREKNSTVYDGITTTDDKYLLHKIYNTNPEAGVLDFTTSIIYEMAKNYSFEALSILNVCKNISTNEVIEEAIRQSGGHASVLLALEVLSFDGGMLQ
jgi:Purine-nucleoside phosphorylase